MVRLMAARVGYVAVGLVATLAANAAPSRADEFYRGKQVSVYIGYGPGGTYDTYGRLLAHYMSRYVPGNPTFVPRNMPGAGSKLLASYLYSAAPKDGREFGVIWSGLILDSLLDESRSEKFDASRFSWIGSMNKSTRGGVVWHTAPAQSLEDALHKTMVVGSTGARSGLGLYPLLLNRLIGAKFKIVGGYKGSTDMSLAMERGELDAIVGIDIANILNVKPDWFAAMKAKVFLQLSLQKDPQFPHAPLVMDFISKAEDRQFMKLFLAADDLSYLFIAPPSIPADRLRVLREAFVAVTKDPAFLVEAKKRNVEVKPTSGEAIASLVSDIYSTPASLLAQARALVNKQ
ncbi:MAG: hypothetical protein K2Y71_13050 [Xanthobacteraceae bacterium]|nr:hypothetical protein [Xanthobacteraceae bacterium]